MRGNGSRRRYRLDPITDQVPASSGENASKLPGVILFAAVIGVAPLAYALDWLLGADWLVSVSAAAAIAALLAVNASLLVRP